MIIVVRRALEKSYTFTQGILDLHIDQRKKMNLKMKTSGIWIFGSTNLNDAIDAMTSQMRSYYYCTMTLAG